MTVVMTALPDRNQSPTALALGSLDQFEQARPYRVESPAGAIVLVRIGDDVYALGDRCSHQNVPLSEGDVYADDKEIECHRHGSTFSLLTGDAMNLPATRPVPTYDVTVDDGGQVTLWLEHA